ncbi:hypothetical protein BGZ97_002215 [Linnemannia gamsii]|uniref:Uncharacterized protein n=1 Tax=Linnemannia gamsii TaxID=64522 RepID=A0A9P6QX53_9FUNG|nr:hypothetical protein BGZ97_002215 [Linnemannia gamsii]
MLLCSQKNQLRPFWHAGSVQLVKWSKNYARQLPKDTTVDIILADAKTNKKIFSLKRFIPFRKGSAQVWVPSKIPDNEDASYVLILDLFHGKSQKPVAVDSAKASAATVSASLSSSSESEIVKPVSTTRASTTGSNGAEAAAAVPEAITPADAKGGSANSKKSLPSILRRSDINIYKRAIPSPPSSSATTTSTSSTTSATRENHRIAAAAADSARADVLPPSQPYTGHHQTGDLADDDSIDPNQAAASYYNNYGHDNYLRQEFPNVIHPIELEHSFGVHQKVYSRAPYTLEWKVPSRAAELLDYTATRLRLLANKDIDWSQHQSIRDNNITYQAKLLVELVRDGGPGQGEALEAVAVLARNVPVETKFQYLQIHDHVDPAFYRLRVQMLVVEVDDTPAGRGRSKNNEDPMLDGWDFAKGAQVIDRYESITRKFWVSAGAL